MNKCLFLDRDGVINKDHGYAYRPEDIEFIPGIFSLCQQAQQRGYNIIIATNQSGIARGYYSEANFQALNDWMKQQFSQRFVRIQHIYHCPHHPNITGPCACRKPNPGMLLKAINQHAINTTHSIMIGDKESDMIAAKAAKIGRRILFTEKSLTTACLKRVTTRHSAATERAHTLKSILA